MPAKRATYEAYIRGRFFWNLRSPEGLRKAIKYFKSAVALEPKFAPAHAGMADAYALLGVLGLVPPDDVFPKAKTAAMVALEIDQSLAEAHATLGHVRMVYDWDWSGSEREFKHALELNFNCSAAHLWYGILLAILRRHDEAIGEMTNARELDPLSLSVNSLLGFVYMRARRYTMAARACKDAIELDPNNPFGHWILARVFDAQHETQKALIESRKAVDLSRGELPFSAHLGYALARQREKGAARQIVKQLIKSSRRRYVSPYLIALIYTALSEKDSAFKWLEKAYSERAARITELSDPQFDRIRSDRRFQGLAQRVGVADFLPHISG
jgi:tetratricopeptide (TPR) repeat protein